MELQFLLEASVAVCPDVHLKLLACTAMGFHFHGCWYSRALRHSLLHVSSLATFPSASIRLVDEMRFSLWFRPSPRLASTISAVTNRSKSCQVAERAAPSWLHWLENPQRGCWHVCKAMWTATKVSMEFFRFSLPTRSLEWGVSLLETKARRRKSYAQ